MIRNQKLKVFVVESQALKAELGTEGPNLTRTSIYFLKVYLSTEIFFDLVQSNHFKKFVTHSSPLPPPVIFLIILRHPFFYYFI